MVQGQVTLPKHGHVLWPRVPRQALQKPTEEWMGIKQEGYQCPSRYRMPKDTDSPETSTEGIVYPEYGSDH